MLEIESSHVFTLINTINMNVFSFFDTEYPMVQKHIYFILTFFEFHSPIFFFICTPNPNPRKVEKMKKFGLKKFFFWNHIFSVCLDIRNTDVNSNRIRESMQGIHFYHF